jgi:hypothetical protein
MAEQRRDLGAMLYALTRVVVDAEVPVLGKHDVDMWEYVVLPTPTTGATASSR